MLAVPESWVVPMFAVWDWSVDLGAWPLPRPLPLVPLPPLRPLSVERLLFSR